MAVTFRIRQFPRDENDALFLMGNVVKHLPRSCAQDAGTRNPAKRYLRYKVSVVKMYRLRDTLLLLLHWKERELGHNSVWLCSHFSQFSSGI